MNAPARPAFAEFLAESGLPEDLARVLGRLAEGATRIAEELRCAGLAGILGSTGETNVQGEAVKKMDVISNEILVESFRRVREVSLIASEEMDEALALPGGGEFGVLFDPLDGSSNIDAGGCVGSIVSLRRLPRGSGTSAALLRKGTEQAAAAYVNYGPATTLVFTAGEGVHLFTLDPGRNEFLLTQRGLRIPRSGKVYAANEGQCVHWHPATRRFLQHLQTPGKVEGAPYSTRYSGCLVTDVHRILLEGGIYLYPADRRDPAKPSGKLRLLYECAPLAMVVEAAGGKASTGRGPIREVQPTAVHQRVPLYIGSPMEVGLAEEFEAGRA